MPVHLFLITIERFLTLKANFFILVLDPINLFINMEARVAGTVRTLGGFISRGQAVTGKLSMACHPAPTLALGKELGEPP